MNNFNKLPYDIAIQIETETNKRIEEFIKFNSQIYKKFSFDEQEAFENWLTILTTYEFYRMYGITDEDMPKNIDIPEFRNLK